MRLDRFSATADVVGGRIWLDWEYALDALETPGDVPDILLRRKQRDFDFPPLVPGDPYLVYDSAGFPPAPVPGAVQVIDLPSEERVEDGLRVVTEAVSVAGFSDGQPVETQRRARSIFYDRDGAPVRVRDALLDAGGIEPFAAYYYELDDGAAPGPELIGQYRRTVTAGAGYGLNRRLYAMLPEIYRSFDTHQLPPAAAWPGVPEATPIGGQLRRFIDMFGVGLDALRSSAETLRNLRDPQTVEARLLPLLAGFIGWDPSNTVAIPQQRNELQTANRLFDVVGTIPAMAALVTHQTGWRAQIAEFAQHIARTNLPPRRNLFIRAEQAGGGWRGADDAGPLFAFPAGVASGAGAFPAMLASAAVEPFALRAGMELTITVDGGVPARVRFGPDDFADMSAATAAEAATAIAAAFDTLEAEAAGGAVVLRTVTVGPAASLAVEAMDESLLALSDAPDGPIAGLAEPGSRLRWFYEQQRDPAPSERAAVESLEPRPAGEAATRAARALRRARRSRRSIAYKSWGDSLWRGERRLPDWTGNPASPAATLAPDGRLLICWSDRDRPLDRALRMATGRPRPPRAATIAGRRGQPFALIAGTRIAFVGRFGTEIFIVQAADYASLAAATAAEVAAAIAAQCPSLTAAAAGGAVRVSTLAVGETARLAVDLAGSTAARALGFADRRLAGRGEWDPDIDWIGPLAGPVTGGPAAEPSLCADPAGGARLFWAEHDFGRWRIRQAHWSERLTVATAQGVSQQAAGGPWTTWLIADGLPSDDVRAVAADARGALWFATAAGLAERRAEGLWTAFTTVDGLGSNDLRDIALLPDGGLWIATPAGLSVRDSAGAFSVISAGPAGLIDPDVKAVAADARGNGWAATPTGISRRGFDGIWRSWTVADGVPGGAPGDLAIGPDAMVALATASGVGIFDGDAWHSYGAADGLPSADVRGVAWDGENRLYAATSAGLGVWDGRRWRRQTPAEGLPAADLRSIALLADGRLAIGTATGLIVGHAFAPAGAWIAASTADGLAGPIVVGVTGGLSAPVTLADAGGGNREPRAIVDPAGRTWLFWAKREEVAGAASHSWTLRLRRYDPGTASWDAETAVTAPVAGVADREPAPEPAGGGFRLFFSSDRGGGRALWSVAVSALGAAGIPIQLTAGAAESSRPAPIPGPDGETWLASRSDVAVALAQVAMIGEPKATQRLGGRVPEARALVLNAGARTPVLAHAARNLGRRRWGDYYVYTPEHPDRMDAETPSQSHVYTRRTVGLFLRQSPVGAAMTPESVGRLRQLLKRFLPVNLRLILVVSPDPLTEFVYAPGADIGESWSDGLPVVEALDGLADAFSAAMPGVGVLILNNPAHLTFSAAMRAALLRRTWFPDLI